MLNVLLTLCWSVGDFMLDVKLTRIACKLTHPDLLLTSRWMWYYHHAGCDAYLRLISCWYGADIMLNLSWHIADFMLHAMLTWCWPYAECDDDFMLTLCWLHATRAADFLLIWCFHHAENDADFMINVMLTLCWFDADLVMTSCWMSHYLAAGFMLSVMLIRCWLLAKCEVNFILT